MYLLTSVLSLHVKKWSRNITKRFLHQTSENSPLPCVHCLLHPPPPLPLFYLLLFDCNKCPWWLSFTAYLLNCCQDNKPLPTTNYCRRVSFSEMGGAWTGIPEFSDIDNQKLRINTWHQTLDIGLSSTLVSNLVCMAHPSAPPLPLNHSPRRVLCSHVLARVSVGFSSTDYCMIYGWSFV